ncbi:recombinase family protein [Altererythrobacter luteolus]|uniref:Recombinase family protein n=1 Tax=Pontixanthobacter luteolus TaxID=295089 RepID=A0A6I4V3D5_9SPHN|nr:recombinase family protein [Pontixanthobacter luteolus]MXP48225.1 recombinase family protein [Pontixanthobacter luteolus]
MKRCYAYIRVSTVKQGDGVSLEAQKEAIELFACQNDIAISEWFEEKITAAKKGRPVFNRMIAQLRKRKADGLVIYKIDRSARNLADWARIGELADLGIDIHFATESLDFRSRGGRLAADVQAVVAADYVRNLREECIKGINGRLKQGLYPFKAPIGYLDNGGGKPKTPDPERAPLIRRAFERYATGQYSQRAVLADVTARGLRKGDGSLFRPQNLELILGNPFYCGMIRIKKTGSTYRGCHEPLIPVSIFERVQDVKAGKALKKVTRHNHTYRLLFRCKLCAGPMVPERQKGHAYYRCHSKDCRTKSVREEAIEAAVTECLQAAQLSEDEAANIKKKFDDWFRQTAGSDPTPMIQARRQEIAGKLDRLTDALIDRLIDQETFQERKKSLLFDDAGLIDQAQEWARNCANPQGFMEFLELTKSLVSTYEMAAPPERRTIVEMTTSNRTVNGKNVVLEPSKWLMDLRHNAVVLFGGPHRGAGRTGGANYNNISEVFCSAQISALEKISRKFVTSNLKEPHGHTL